MKESLIIENDIRQLEIITKKYLLQPQDGTDGPGVGPDGRDGHNDSNRYNKQYIHSNQYDTDSKSSHSNHSYSNYNNTTANNTNNNNITVDHVIVEEDGSDNECDNECVLPPSLSKRSRTVSDSVMESKHNPNRSVKHNANTGTGVNVHHANLNNINTTNSNLNSNVNNNTNSNINTYSRQSTMSNMSSGATSNNGINSNNNNSGSGSGLGFNKGTGKIDKIGLAMGNHTIKAADLKLEKELTLQNMIRGNKHSLTMIVPDNTNNSNNHNSNNSTNNIPHSSYTNTSNNTNISNNNTNSGHRIDEHRVISSKDLYTIIKKNANKTHNSTHNTHNAHNAHNTHKMNISNPNGNNNNNNNNTEVTTLKHPLTYHGSDLPDGYMMHKILEQLKLTELPPTETTKQISIELYLCKLGSVLECSKGGIDSHAYEDVISNCMEVSDNHNNTKYDKTPHRPAPSIYDKKNINPNTTNRINMHTNGTNNNNSSNNSNSPRRLQSRLSIRNLTAL